MAAQVVYVDFNSLTPRRSEIYQNPNIWAQKSNQYQNQNVTYTRRDSRTLNLRRSFWTGCSCCPSCCPCLLFLLGFLIVAGLAAAIALPIIFTSSDSTSTTEAVVAFSNDNTTTSTVTTTTTDSTSTSSASTSIFVSTSTMTISTSTMITSTSTMTTSTSTFTTTSKTTSTSTTTSTTTTTPNSCMAGYANSIQLLNLSLNALMTWTTYRYNFTSPNVTALTLMFSFRSDPTFWYLDDVIVSNSTGQQLLTNGNFETGSFGSKWVYCNPKNTTAAGKISSSLFCQDWYCYADGSVGGFDYLSQKFNVQPYKNYGVQFKLRLDDQYIVNVTFASISLLY